MTWYLRTFLTICLITLPLFLYVGLRLAASIGSLFPATGSRPRLVVLLVMVWLYALPAGAYLYTLWRGASTFSFLSGSTVTWIDYLFYYPVWIGLILVLELVTWYLLLDAAALAIRFIPAIPRQLVSAPAWGRLVLGALAVVYVPARVVLDTGWVRDSTEHVAVKGLPSQLAGVTITLVGDIQVDRYTGESAVARVRRIIEERRPGLLVSAGDLVTSGTGFLDLAEKALAGLRGATGTFAVMGDHDIWSAPEAIHALYERDGWSFLENEHRVFSWNGSSVLVTGLTYVYSSRPAVPDLERFLAAAPKADLRILLVHQPAEPLIRAAAAHGYMLVLAGHTHGGQIVFHPFGFTFTPSMRETRYYAGVYGVGETQVVVTRGVGLTLAPVRYHAPAEVTTIVLEPAP